MNLSQHIKVLLLCIIATFCFGTISAQQHKNPLLDMIGKPYGDYFDPYVALCDSLFSGDSDGRARLLSLLAEAAAADPTGEWELDRQRMEKHVRFYNSRNGGFTPSADYTTEDFTTDLLNIATRAQKEGFTYIHLLTLFNAGDAFRIFAQDYEQAFRCYLAVAAELEKVTQKEFPWKLFIYREMAYCYSSFREYKEAAVYWQKIIDDPYATLKNNHRLYPALHGLGVYYRDVQKYDQSDSCFARILQLSAPIPEDSYVWEGIAKGNIGNNHYLRGDMDKALEWMIPALQKIQRPEDDSYTVQLAADIADIYLKKGDTRSAKKYLDTALRYHNRSRLPRKSSHLLQVMAHYHAASAGQPAVSAYLDSALLAKESENEAFSGLVLRRVEQRLRAADRKAYEQELNAEKMRSDMYRFTAIVIACALTVILLLLFAVSFYYHRTRRAYRELVRKSQEWAGIEPSKLEAATDALGDGDEEGDAATCKEPKPQPLPTPSDHLIMEEIEKAIQMNDFYKQPDLTLDMLVVRTGLNRGYLSAALNRCTGKNFSTYINEFRVKEAIRLMSESQNENLTIEAIGFDAGFNDRSSFYRIFKKITGLSPTEFRKNIKY